MSAIVLAVTLTATGWASHYAPGVMESTVAARQRMGHLPVVLPDVAGYVARPHPSDIGRVIWLKPNGGFWEPFLVADCGGVADGGRDWMLDNRILVEVDYLTAARWGSVGRGVRVEMSFEKPPPGKASRLALGVVA